MAYLIWRLRYTVRAFRGGYDLKTAWYTSGCCEDYWQDTHPYEAADSEISYAREGQ